jgi:hypothetical protein
VRGLLIIHALNSGAIFGESSMGCETRDAASGLCAGPKRRR